MKPDPLMQLELDLKNAKSFDEMVEVVGLATLMIDGFKALRDRAIVKADESGPYADRKAIGTAAGLKPSSLYRILVRYGRPTNRKKAVQ